MLLRDDGREDDVKVLVVGGTGFIGMPLARTLLARGDEVVVSSRAPERAKDRLPAGATTCGPAVADLAAAARGARAVVNLAGANLSDRRWTPEVKRLIRDSRVSATNAVVEALASQPEAERPGVLVSGSAVGLYGDRGDMELTEDAPPGAGFLAETCVAWERAARAAEAHGVRVVTLRIGVVLGPGGGALARMKTPFRLFAGGPLGSGRQWISWIHVDDVLGLALHAIDHAALRGPVNATAPAPVRFADFARAFGKALGRPSWLPVPAFAVKLALGEMGSVVLESTRVLPAQALAAGYRFRFTDVEAACRAALGAEGALGAERAEGAA